MKIERVDDKTVKCYISNEELQEYDLDYKDFIMRSDRAKEMVHEIMEQAIEEVGYTPPKFAFDLQIMVVPEQGLVLTFSEKDPFEDKETGNEKLRDCLMEMKQLLQKTKAQMGLGGTAGSQEQNGQATQTDAAAENAGDATTQVENRPDISIFVFESLDQVGRLAAALPVHLRVISRLYAYREMYYLYMAKGAAAYERYAKACVQALEFGKLYSAEEESLLFLEEHGDCIIEEKALRKLAKVYAA